MLSMLRDIRLGVRSLARDKAYTATFIATISVCIAANSATFAIVNSVLLEPLPVQDSDSILLMANRYPGAGVTASFNSASGDYYDRLEAISAFEEQALFRLGGETLELGGMPRRVDRMSATPSLFRLLGASAALGRTFTEDEGEIGQDAKVILSHGLWQELFGGEASAVGRDLRVSGKPHTIVGVMPADFSFVNPDVRMWTPQAFSVEEKQVRHSNNYYSIGRLKPGATLEQAQAQVEALNAANIDSQPQLRQLLIDAQFHTKVLPLREMIVGDIRTMLYLLGGGAIFVLLIGALNITNLAFVRLSQRRREVATRRALGARRHQAMRQTLVESVLASLAGGLAGVGLGAVLLRWLRAYGLDELPRAAEIHMDAEVALIALAASALAGTLIGLAALAQASRINLNRALREDGRGGAGSRTTNRLRQTLVAAQIGFAFVLLLGAGLLFTSLRQLLLVDPGFRTEGVLTVSTRAPSASYPDNAAQRELMRRSLEAIRSVPGVLAAGATSSIPFGGSTSDSVIFAEGYQMQPGESVISPRQLSVTPGFFEAMEIEVLKGRDFTEHDDENAPAAVIVDERLAERFWPGEDPVGRRMYQPDSPEDLMRVDENTRWLHVVGVVRSVRLNNLEGTGTPVGAYYFPSAQQPPGFFTFAIQTAGDREAAAVANEVRSRMAGVDPELALFDLHTMKERAELSLSSKRTAMLLAVGFGGVALFLAAIGVYGLLAYHVTQRRREIGIRMALGGTASRIVRLVMREGVALSAVGLLLGGAGAVALERVIATEIYGVSALDPGVVGAVAAVLAMVAATASALPARRAGRIDPVRAINSD